MFGNLKIGTLMGSFYPKKKMCELKIYRGVLCHDNEEWYKIWRGFDSSVQNWHEEFDKCWLEHSKISKICALIGCFWAKYIKFELKKVDRSYVCGYWRLMQNLIEKLLVLSKNFVYRLKNSDFVLENKMAELSCKQNLLIYFENC